MKNRILLSFALIAALVVTSCKKDDNGTPNTGGTPSAAAGTVKITFDHRWEGENFVPNETTTYINSSSNDTLSFTMFRYYISNIRLKKADGTEYVQPDSYFLVNAADAASSTITIPNVPAGTYTDVSYTFGVDSTRNVSGAQSGALDPSYGMFWSWSTGYIMLKAEGISPNSPSQSGSFAFHLGGFQGPNKVVIERQMSLTPAGSLNLGAASTKSIHIDVHVEKMWDNSPSLSAVYDLQSPGAAAKTMAQSFINGMLLNHID